MARKSSLAALIVVDFCKRKALVRVDGKAVTLSVRIGGDNDGVVVSTKDWVVAIVVVVIVVVGVVVVVVIVVVAVVVVVVVGIIVVDVMTVGTVGIDEGIGVIEEELTDSLRKSEKVMSELLKRGSFPSEAFIGETVVCEESKGATGDCSTGCDSAF